MSDQGFPKSIRLRTQPDFDRVYRSDFFAADSVLVIRGVENQLDKSRLGLSVSRKVGNAVVRNRWKRLIREIFRKHQSQIPTGIDLVIRPRKGAICEYARIEESLPKLVMMIDKRIQNSKTG